METATNFYSKLYSKDNCQTEVINEYIESVNLSNTVSIDDKNLCDKSITEKEVYTIIKDLKNEKSPGLDGIIPEFYKKCWNYIKEPFMDMLYETFDAGELPESAKKAVLALIFKKGRKRSLKKLQTY